MYECIFYNITCNFNLVYSSQTMKKNKRGQEWGKGWDGKSRVPDKTYKENYDSIDWSYIKKEKKNDKNNISQKKIC